MKRALILTAALLALPSAADEARLADLGPEAVAGMIDATSFRNSIGPRRQDGLRTFADYGFTEVEVVDRTVELYEPDRSWMFGITVLQASDDRLVVCVLDKALGGPTYDAQKAVAFERGNGGLLVARDDDVVDAGCPARP
jgi:hypothetical protein